MLKCVETLYHNRMKEVAPLVNVHDAYASFARGDTGGLRITRFGYTGAVELWSTGENGHECGFKKDNFTQTGKGILRWRSESDPEECRLDIIPDGDDMRVEVKDCRQYCGARATMDGTYSRLP